MTYVEQVDILPPKNQIQVNKTTVNVVLSYTMASCLDHVKRDSHLGHKEYRYFDFKLASFRILIMNI